MPLQISIVRSETKTYYVIEPREERAILLVENNFPTNVNNRTWQVPKKKHDSIGT